MKTVTFAQAQAIVSGALAHARANNFKPLGVAVLDVRGALTAYAAEDGATLGRAQVAMGESRRRDRDGHRIRARSPNVRRNSSTRSACCFRWDSFPCRAAC